ncbi:unnamed protein product [Zymoseptoria tritici ST99CH_1A5]|uniref:Heterokaryon incompatibility domain-containing protein n=1 Tax=Zymoseptoria tritici ST99CH_1A5 TaxID=1276529 RepID=A0A1Y6LLT3_ZYMTR|nr:unnamed protein product [Zymoseptoria tritici ST99CH_1A5]
MRLLNVHTLAFHSFHSASTPRYAIASHRWVAGTEAAIKDVEKQRNTESLGYQKVLRFLRYVREHVPGVEWLWIDTCCIDQKSSQEVSEAVNSMLKYYSRAAVCLAYLRDVSHCSLEAFETSEWFTRGWTLQELLAPSLVIFLSNDWNVLGHKGRLDPIDGRSMTIGASLEATITKITSIPPDILHDYNKSKTLSLEQKFTWMEGRTTTREEDMSYCLFGIFEIAIGSNYGEGLENARKRLLKAVTEAAAEKSTSPLLLGTIPETSTADSSTRDLIQKRSTEDSIHMLLKSLHFPQIDSRKDQVITAHQGTYQWSLISSQASDVPWDNMVNWLGERDAVSQIYWINAKPGSGKSSLLKFLDDNLALDQHMVPWAEGLTVLRLRYYFWGPGNTLQHSLEGLMRTLLHQLYQQLDNRFVQYVPHHKWTSAQTSRGTTLKWTVSELRESLRIILSYVSRSCRVLFILDGLDEIDGDEDSRDDLAQFVQELARWHGVKLIVSSRRWTVFQDAFATCPQLRLEDLNYQDIRLFVEGQLQSNARYQQMVAHEPRAVHLVAQLTSKAEGVFLWVRLIIKELFRGIRDGDTYAMLEYRVQSLPSDLSQYFAQLFDSIEPRHRREACIFFQIALQRETEFDSLQPLRLLDLLFVPSATSDFALSPSSDDYIKIFADPSALAYRLDSLLRNLLSRCKGLLDCHFRPGSTDAYFNFENGVHFQDEQAEMSDIERIKLLWGLAPPPTLSRAISTLPPNLVSLLLKHKHVMLDLQVDFMHRSLRDFLLEPSSQEFLASHIGVLFDGRNYLRNVRLTQIRMVLDNGMPPQLTVGLASYFISSLSVATFRRDPRSVLFAQAFEPMIEYVRSAARGDQPWYINSSLDGWDLEGSTFLSLAVDFGLIAYVEQALTSEKIREKRDRPLLDYVLRPRFAGEASYHSVGLQAAAPELVRRLIHLGADPNEEFQGSSIFALFLSFVMSNLDNKGNTDEDVRSEYLSSLEVMLEGGAGLRLSHRELAMHSRHGINGACRNPSLLIFSARWKNLEHTRGGVDTLDLLKRMRPVFGDGIDRSIALVEQRIALERQEPRRRAQARSSGRRKTNVVD